MINFLEFTWDKFTFKVAADRLYTAEGVWVKADGERVTIGVSDFFQQRNGDVAFVEVWEKGSAVSAGDEFATIETIKVDIGLPCPVSGAIAEVNETLELEAEVINQDPYGGGWIAIIEAADWPADRANLITPQAYYELIKVQAQEDEEL